MNRLLSGEVVTLVAPVYNTAEELNAVKFRQAHLELVPHDSSKLSELTEALEPYFVNMTHSGFSQFRVNGKFYTIEHDPVPLFFSYSKTDRLANTGSSDAYKKLAKGDWAISPYTSWKIQLKASFTKKTGFSALEKFKDLPINLKLCGEIRFFTEDYTNSPRVKDNIDRFYPESLDDHLHIQEIEEPIIRQ